MANGFSHMSGLIRAIGVFRALEIVARRKLKRPNSVQVLMGGHRIAMRPMDSDLFVASQIFGWRDYEFGAKVKAGLRSLGAKWRKSGLVPLIVDGGANVGYSSLFFADAFPDALVLAVEPHPATFAVLRENVAKEPRILPVHAALWSHDEGVSLKLSEQFGSWAHSVDEGGGATPSWRLDNLIETVPNARPLIIKLDIEGAEKEVCAASKGIMGNVPCILLEPHDFMLPGAATLTPLFSVIAARRCDTLLMGENLLFVDSALAAG